MVLVRLIVSSGPLDPVGLNEAPVHSGEGFIAEKGEDVAFHSQFEKFDVFRASDGRR